jgi:sugar phosphate isomerase/epimerase
MAVQRIGVQLYSLRDLAARDLPAVIEKVARIGYEGVEFAGLHEQQPARLRRVVDGLGLTTIGAHVGLADLENRRDETLADLVELGCDRAIIAWLPHELYADEPTARRTVERLVVAGDAVRAAGLGYAYHNHAFEFERVGQTTLWSLLLETPAADIPLEIDVYWVRNAGLEPAPVIREAGSRVDLLHVKDTAADGSDCAVGHGVEPWPEVLTASRSSGVEWLIVEQEQSIDMLADIESSLVNLRRLIG